MRIETPEVKREDGSRFKIVIGIGGYTYGKLTWKIADVMIKEPRKRNWVSHETIVRSSLQYSGIPYDERDNVIQQKLAELVGEEWVKQAFRYAYNYIKPDILKEKKNE